MNYVPDMNRVRNCSARIISSRREVVYKKGGQQWELRLLSLRFIYTISNAKIIRPLKKTLNNSLS
jgi:hypothetical protein